MKYFHSMILTGLIIHLFHLSAEPIPEEEAPSARAPELVANREETPLSASGEELELLGVKDDLYWEFEEKLSSAEEEVQTTALLHPEAEPVSSFIQDPTENAPFFADSPDAGPEVITLTGEFADIAETSPPVQTDFVEEELEIEAPATLVIQDTAAIGEIGLQESDTVSIDLKQAFAGSPIIYTLLFSMSVTALCIWLYSILSIRTATRVPQTLLNSVQSSLGSNQFEEALSLCEENSSLFCKMVSSGIHTRRHGLPMMVEAMKAEGKRSTVSFWQTLGILNDIAIIAPMIGLLGTVLGMFYAFYDINRSIESISTLFDGLGISVGTTVAGLVVAILALILHSTARYRLVRALSIVENRAHGLATQIDNRTSTYKG